MKVSAILCHHKGDLILKAIQSLRRQKNVEIEIIVVTSFPNTSFFGTKTVYVQGGPAYKRNVGFRFASHDLIAFFDDDIEADPIAVVEMSRYLKDDIGMVFGKLLNMEFRNKFDEAGSFLTQTGFLWSRASSYIEDTGQFEKVETILSGKSASCMITRNVFSQVGMFDPSYEILGEETDLAWRVWLYGWKVLFVPSSVTYHAFNTRYKPKDFYIPRRVYFNGSRNYLSMLITNLHAVNLIIPCVVQVSVWVMASIGMILTGKFEAGYYILKGLGWVFFNLRHILRKRRAVQKIRKISDKELFKFIRRDPPVRYYIHRFFHYIKTGRHG